ncbi:MAG TPA: hypothetical protein VGN99_03860 [Steroidobacteraceae bacterium]|nr:hypothetical protein [Steroidobacteraceae bacterium]
MSSRLSRRCWVFLAALVLVGTRALGDSNGSVPAGVILVKGAWTSAAGTAIPLPEEGAVANGKYGNPYFGLEYAFGADWTQRYEGPPPSESGYYVLAQIEPRNPGQSFGQSHVLIAAQDLFFTLNPASDALGLIHYYQEHLGAEYRVQQPPRKVQVANRDFVRFDYFSPAAGLQWHVLATEIRCHVVLFTFTGSDAQITRRLIESMGTMPHGSGSAPVCIKNYVSAENITERADPVLSAPRFNPVPVRIVIDTEGKVKHIHFLSAFPDQAKNIADALSQWRFKPLIVGGQPAEVETGLMFGRPPRPSASAQH